MILYQTEDIESSIRRMALSNEYSIVFQHTWCLRQIRAKLNEVSDIPSMLVLPWESGAKRIIHEWINKKGLLYYRHMPVYIEELKILPDTDALMFTECPVSIKDLEHFQDNARKEIIIYRPPDWSMHDEMMEYKFPFADTYRRMFEGIDSLMGKHAELTRNQQAALSFSGWPADKTAVFGIGKMAKIASINENQMKRLFKRGPINLRGHYMRYDCFKPMIEPFEPDLLEMYNLLESLPDCGMGLRILPFGRLPKYVKFFEKAMKILVKSGCVMRYDSVHIVLGGFKKVDYEVMDAIANVRRNGCMRLRKMVEEAPIYG